MSTLDTTFPSKMVSAHKVSKLPHGPNIFSPKYVSKITWLLCRVYQSVIDRWLVHLAIHLSFWFIYWYQIWISNPSFQCQNVYCPVYNLLIFSKRFMVGYFLGHVSIWETLWLEIFWAEICCPILSILETGWAEIFGAETFFVTPVYVVFVEW